jgi:hypothetical protein
VGRGAAGLFPWARPLRGRLLLAACGASAESSSEASESSTMTAGDSAALRFDAALPPPAVILTCDRIGVRRCSEPLNS